MQTQRDHVHAYQFMVGRMTSALVSGDPGAFEPPARRAWIGLVIGVVLAVLVTAGFGVFGIVRPGGSTAWRKPGVILVEKETGTRYVLLNGALHPTLNQASAMLLQGAGATVQRISRNSLAGLPHGAPVGIAGAPDPVPRPADLVTGPSLLCLAGVTGTGRVSATLLSDALGGPAELLPQREFLLVRSPGGTAYLVWRGSKYRLADDAVAAALGVASGAGPVAPELWLDLVPDGQVIGPAAIEGVGTPGPQVGGTGYDVGQLFEQRVGAEGRQFHVLLRDGIAPLTETEFTLLAGRAGIPDPVSITSAAVVAAPRSADTSLADRLPDLMAIRPAPTTDRSVCLRIEPNGPATPVLAGGLPAGRTARSGGTVGVRLPPSAGLLAGAVPAPAGQRAPTRYLITDQGLAHQIPDDDSLRALGLGAVTPVPMDARLLAAIAAGPSLSRSALGAAGTHTSTPSSTVPSTASSTAPGKG